MPSLIPRFLREIRDDQHRGPVVLERLLMMLTVTMLVVLVTTTIGQSVLLLVPGRGDPPSSTNQIPRMEGRTMRCRSM